MAFRSVVSANTGASGSSVNPGLPAGATSTDILLAFIGGDFGSGTKPIVAPSGWTLVDIQPPGIIAGNGVAIFWALGSVASTVFTTTSGSASFHVAIAAWSGRNNTTPITANAGSENSTNAPSVTAAANDDITAFYYSFGALGSVPAPLTEQLGTSIAGSKFISLCTQDNVSAGATGAFLRSTSVGMTVALAAASSGGSSPISSTSSFNSGRGSSFSSLLSF